MRIQAEVHTDTNDNAVDTDFDSTDETEFDPQKYRPRCAKDAEKLRSQTSDTHHPLTTVLTSRVE
jgi:hypothetical protein